VTEQKHKLTDAREMLLVKLYAADYDFRVPNVKQRQAELTKKFTDEWELN
jgi:hypothetical protein